MCLHEDHCSTLAERDNQKREYSHARESTRIVSSFVMLEASTTVMKQIFCTSLSLCGRQGIDGRPCLGHEPTFLFLHQGAPIVLGVCEGYDRVEEISEGGIVCTTSDCLPSAFLIVFALTCCCCRCLSCRMLFHLVSSTPSSSVQFYHSSCRC